MNALFADYLPHEHGTPLAEAVIRPAVAEDLVATGELAARREGADPAEWVALHQRRHGAPEHQMFVAEHEGRVVGYAWVSHLRPAADGGHGAPDGWYLSGIVVEPSLRRRTLGRRLTQARIDWVLERSDEVFYVVSAANRPSRALHAELGFTELTTDFSLPGVVFGNADGILCRLVRRPDADVVPLRPRDQRAD